MGTKSYLISILEKNGYKYLGRQWVKSLDENESYLASGAKLHVYKILSAGQGYHKLMKKRFDADGKEFWMRIHSDDIEYIDRTDARLRA